MRLIGEIWNRGFFLIVLVLAYALIRSLEAVEAVGAVGAVGGRSSVGNERGNEGINFLFIFVSLEKIIFSLSVLASVLRVLTGLVNKYDNLVLLLYLKLVALK